MKKEQFFSLWLRYRAGTISPGDLVRLSRMIKSGKADLFLKEWMQQEYNITIETVDKSPSDWQQLWQQIQSDIMIKENSGRSYIGSRFKWHLRVAAALLVVGVSGWLFYYNARNHNETIKPANHLAAAAQIKPGKNGALLTLADGTIVPLSDSLTGIIAHQSGNTISFSNGAVSYTAASRREAASYNTLITPIARTINIVLTDGTKVWLNAGSSLHFPTTFTGPYRKVNLTGEGYFEVAKNTGQPFIVTVNGSTEIKVLGTHFNINAYGGEEPIKTTLLEGSVIVKSNTSGKIMVPGQQAHTSNSGVLLKLIDHVDVGAITAWKEGIFEFNGTSIKTIMSELARWYDIDVVYQDKIDAEFVARLPRNESLEKVLALLEATRQVHFIIDKQNITVTK